jgi:hypothetical protein
MFQAQQQPQQSQSNINWIPVNGIQGVKDYMVQTNEKAWFMDNNEPIFYVKSGDVLGKPNIQAFKFEEISLADTEPKYITLADLEEFKKSLISEIKEKKSNGKSVNE